MNTLTKILVGKRCRRNKLVQKEYLSPSYRSWGLSHSFRTEMKSERLMLYRSHTCRCPTPLLLAYVIYGCFLSCGRRRKFRTKEVKCLLSCDSVCLQTNERHTGILGRVLGYRPLPIWVEGVDTLRVWGHDTTGVPDPGLLSWVPRKDIMKTEQQIKKTVPSPLVHSGGLILPLPSRRRCLWVSVTVGVGPGSSLRSRRRAALLTCNWMTIEF